MVRGDFDGPVCELRDCGSCGACADPIVNPESLDFGEAFAAGELEINPMMADERRELRAELAEPSLGADEESPCEADCAFVCGDCAGELDEPTLFDQVYPTQEAMEAGDAKLRDAIEDLESEEKERAESDEQPDAQMQLRLLRRFLGRFTVDSPIRQMISEPMLDYFETVCSEDGMPDVMAEFENAQMASEVDAAHIEDLRRDRDALTESLEEAEESAGRLECRLKSRISSLESELRRTKDDLYDTEQRLSREEREIRDKDTEIRRLESKVRELDSRLERVRDCRW